MVTVDRVEDEAAGIKNIFFKHDLQAKPGQFVMAWLPDMDEKPFAVGFQTAEEFGLTVSAVGPFSNTFSQVKPGDRVGIRGPYGTGYKLEGKKLVMVGGGYGTASLALLADHALQQGCEITFIVGARSKDLLVYTERIKQMGCTLITTTNDGSEGMQGFTTDALEKLLSEQTVDKVFSCGPEKMLLKVAEVCNGKVSCEVSLERYMKCGFGICGHCCVDPIGIRLCVEGPVVPGETALKITELGNYHRVQSSRKETL